MAESETGLNDLMDDLDSEDKNDTGYERDNGVEIIDGFYYQNACETCQLTQPSRDVTSFSRNKHSITE